MQLRIGKKKGIALIGFILIVASFIIIWPKPPQAPEVVNNIDDFELYLEELVNFGTPPGMSLVVVNKNGIVYEKGFGWADKPREISATPETVYHWWSITKIVTAMAIMQLYEQDKLDLDDPVLKYLPYFNMIYPSDTDKKITIRNLLNHSSGIPDAGFKIMRWIHHEGEPHLNQSEMLKTVLPDFSELEFESGTYAQYTNIGYMVLGAIIEEVSNLTYEDYVRQNILKPLEMNHTDFVYTKQMEPFEAAGSHPLFNTWTPLVPFVAGSFIRETHENHIWLERVYTDQTPPSGLIGSASDAARLVIAYLNKGVYKNTRILSEASIDRMSYDSYIKLIDDPETYFTRQGIGWRIFKDNDGVILEHTGGGIGFNTIMQIRPEKDLGFILFTNDTAGESWKIIQLASDLKW